MKRILQTIIATIFVILATAGFGFAEYTATGLSNFPYFQLGCLIIGRMTIISLKHKYDKMYTNEAFGAFALYTVLIALFTNPVIYAIKNFVG